MNFHEPHIDYAGIAPIIALTVGLVVVLMTSVFKPLRRTAPALTLATLAATAGLLIWHWNDSLTLITGALQLDNLAIAMSLIAILMAAACVFLSIGEPATRESKEGGRCDRDRSPHASRQVGRETRRSASPEP